MKPDLVWKFACYNEEHLSRGMFRIKFLRIFTGFAICWYDPNQKPEEIV